MQITQLNYVESITNHRNYILLLLHSKISYTEKSNLTNPVNFYDDYLDLSFRDSYTGIPLTYDIYIQQYKINILRPLIFFFSESVSF